MADHERLDKRRAHEACLVKVRCSGAMHTIRWTPRGRITLLDHSREDLAARRTLHKLGSDECKCVRTLISLREFKNKAGRFEDYLKPALDAARATREARYPDRKEREALANEAALRQSIGPVRYHQRQKDMRKVDRQHLVRDKMADILKGVIDALERLGIMVSERSENKAWSPTSDQTPLISVGKLYEPKSYPLQRRVEVGRRVVVAAPLNYLRLIALKATVVDGIMPLAIIDEEPGAKLLHVWAACLVDIPQAEGLEPLKAYVTRRARLLRDGKDWRAEIRDGDRWVSPYDLRFDLALRTY